MPQFSLKRLLLSVTCFAVVIAAITADYRAASARSDYLPSALDVLWSLLLLLATVGFSGLGIALIFGRAWLAYALVAAVLVAFFLLFPLLLARVAP